MHVNSTAYQKHKPFVSKKEKKRKKHLNYSSASKSLLVTIEIKCVCGVCIINKNGWGRRGSCNRYRSRDDIFMHGSVAT